VNIQPGDKLAYVCGASNPDNVGRIVEILRPAVHGERFKLPDGSTGRTKLHRPCWWVRCATPLLWDLHKGGETRTVRVHERYIADARLRPIRDPGEDAVDETLRVIHDLGSPA
jgi:hypothetical protein